MHGQTHRRESRSVRRIAIPARLRERLFQRPYSGFHGYFLAHRFSLPRFSSSSRLPHANRGEERRLLARGHSLFILLLLNAYARPAQHLVQLGMRRSRSSFHGARALPSLRSPLIAKPPQLGAAKQDIHIGSGGWGRYFLAKSTLPRPSSLSAPHVASRAGRWMRINYSMTRRGGAASRRDHQWA